ncbi:cupin domain-containing protein [uncultured Desulfosarcina sp.]|uniref:cupin domain-containing protein n=1 Tax=uncultured Desulfosarcina sp. TaxID=218289 RepID=UPI0029C82CB6|nr:cupin domain-containing protein [uncultured Desulfosarcina sp.]
MLKKESELTYRKLLDGVNMATMVHGEKTLMARFKLEKGCTIPDHNHPHEQTGLLLSGHMVFTIDGRNHDVMPGDSWCIGSNVPHSVRVLEDAMAVEVFSPVREDYLV